MFASDYPHWDGAWPNATTELREHARGRVTDESLARIAGGNARSFYGLDDVASPGRDSALRSTRDPR
jgi:predicted TIM-barrel fold metal-dependent hydrolase